VAGGTSIAAPQWSGFLALVGEARGDKPLGFLNPIIYGMSDTARVSALHDITSGSNGAYSAGAGFDAVTGLGSMRGDMLFDFLKNN
jgi:kumamolisin